MLGAQTASANWMSAYASASQYTATWSWVPDFDQRRALLPNTGSMYCVPTSAMNWVAYIAHHGYPIIAPPGDHHFLTWQQPQWYNPATSWIELMGQFMQTDENNGTGGTTGINGLKMWLPPAGFILYRYRIVSAYTPRFDDIALWTLNKVPVMAVIGWYSMAGSTITRVGGHVTSVSKVQRSGSSRKIGWRDPANEQTILFNQSTPVTQEYSLDPQLVFNKGFPRVMDKVVNYGSGYLDAYWAIKPIAGLTTTSDKIKFTIIKPKKFSWDTASVLQTINMPAGAGVIKDLKYLPGSPATIVTTEPAPGLATFWKVDELTTDATLLFRLSVGVKKIVMGRNRELYILDNNGVIHCYNIDVDPPVEEAVVTPGDPVQAIAYNDLTDEVVALSASDNIIHKFSEGLVPSGDIAIPVGTSLGANAAIAVCPEDGSLFMTSDTSNAVTHMFFDAAGALMTETIGAGDLLRPQSISVGDGDILYVSTNSAMKVFTKDAAGAWAEDLTNPFAGQPVSATMQIPYSRSNGDRAEEGLPENFNVLPTEFAPPSPECYYDLDLDGSTGPGDLLGLLAGWGDPFGPTELLAMLASWGTCPTTP